MSYSARRDAPRAAVPCGVRRARAQEWLHVAARFAGAALAPLCALRERVVYSHAAAVLCAWM